MSATTQSPSPQAATSAAPTDRENKFDWPLCYQAEELILNQLEQFLKLNSFARNLSDRMRTETATLFLDWVDHLVVPASARPRFEEVGYVADPLGETETHQQALYHPEAMLPRVLLDRTVSDHGFPLVAALRVESVVDFLAAHEIGFEPEGSPLSRLRRVKIFDENRARLEAVERRGYRGYLLKPHPSGELESILKARDLWQTRVRRFSKDASGFAHALELLDRMIGLVGRDLACHIVFEGERIYWEKRNRAGREQKRRQDQLGLGWANHDHHTFRSSREHFVELMMALEKLGFERRERYYAGAQAGWGAQILEQPVEGIVAFCDVDLAPEETAVDFSRERLSSLSKLGTIGLWVGLHGESFLEAGMHHLECRFDYQLLRDQLAERQINTMNPFSDFPFLKQAFTEGERWPVRRERAEHLLRNKSITEEQFQQFLKDGAIGSHLENLQRKGGFKGFNQKSVSVIIEATDPRKGH